jgi:alkylation response protein AidB-like acyl-CoA dehydrogenase
VEYAGSVRSIREQFLVEKEVALHGGPASDAIARVIVAPTLMDAGNPEQKKKYLPGLARGEITFCLGCSEPFPCLHPGRGLQPPAVEDIEEGR